MSDDIADVDQAWITATSNVLETRDEIHAAAVAGGPAETVKLCMFASLVPATHFTEYMDKMTQLHNILIEQCPEMTSTRPDKAN